MRYAGFVYLENVALDRLMRMVVRVEIFATYTIESARLHNTKMASNRVVRRAVLVVHDVKLAPLDYCLIASRRMQILSGLVNSDRKRTPFENVFSRVLSS